MFWISHFASDFFGKFFWPVSVVSIEADPALGVPYGNDLQFPGVFGKWYLYVFPEGHLRTLELVWWDGAQEFTYVWVFAAE